MEFYDRQSTNKIPYDNEPIIRQSNYKKPIRVSSGGNGGSSGGFWGKTLALLVCLMLIVNIIVLAVVIKRGGGTQTNINQTDVTIQSSSGLDVAAVASKAKMSVVSVNSGRRNTQPVRTKADFDSLRSKGSGVIFEDDKESGVAYILTCLHVVYNYPDDIYVMLYDNYTPIPARRIQYYSSVYDIAVIRIESDEYKSENSQATRAEVANSSYIAEGDGVVAIGNAQGQGISVTSGTISKVNDFVTTDSTNGVSGAGSRKRAIRTDAAINTGNSGGGLFNDRGQLIGIVNAKSGDTSVSGVAYAVHSNVALSIARNVLRNSQAPVKADIGLNFTATKLRLEEVGGKYIPYEEVYVSSIEDGSPFAGSSLKGDGTDRVLGFWINNQYVEMVSRYTFDDYAFTISKGDTVVFKVRHSNGNEENITIKVERVVNADLKDWYKNS